MPISDAELEIIQRRHDAEGAADPDLFSFEPAPARFTIIRGRRLWTTVTVIILVAMLSATSWWTQG